MFFCVVFGFCSNDHESEHPIPVVRVNETYLYKDNILNSLPKNLGTEDSVSFVAGFINNWIREQVLLNKAEYNLNNIQKDVEQQLEDYRRTLLIYNYENQYLSQNLDTFVNESEIKAYYEQNKKDFLLKDYIVKVVYAKFDKAVKDRKKLINWFVSGKDENDIKFIEYCKQNAVNFYADNQSWLYFDELLKEVPVEIYNKEAFIKKGRINFEDDSYLYFLNFLDHKMKNGISPLSLKKDDIKQILLHQRKTELIKKMRSDIVDDAYKSKEIEIYETK